MKKYFTELKQWLSSGLNTNRLFDSSELEKGHNQKELIEDSALINRMHTAAERRVFYVDVGNMPAHKIMDHIERVKNELLND